MKKTSCTPNYRWDIVLRFSFIETVAWWEGRLTSGHITRSFGISRQQASKHINTYINDLAPNNLIYDKFLKGYVPTPEFKPLFIKDDARDYIDLLHQHDARTAHVNNQTLEYSHVRVIGLPHQPLQAQALRPLIKACREQLRLKIEYISLSTTEPTSLIVSPHTLVCSDQGWHVRAYCETSGCYCDFALSRLKGMLELQESSPHRREEDVAWNTTIVVTLAASERLTPAHRAIVEAEYGMLGGELEIPIQPALAKYVLHRYRITPKNASATCDSQHLILRNFAELAPWLDN
ncbi:MAG: WYL domain-containing protein [Pseudomonas sp.]|nr:WYL domain-containing protein [Pseudomonas sp.]